MTAPFMPGGQVATPRRNPFLLPEQAYDPVGQMDLMSGAADRNTVMDVGGIPGQRSWQQARELRDAIEQWKASAEDRRHALVGEQRRLRGLRNVQEMASDNPAVAAYARQLTRMGEEDWNRRQWNTLAELPQRANAALVEAGDTTPQQVAYDTVQGAQNALAAAFRSGEHYGPNAGTMDALEWAALPASFIGLGRANAAERALQREARGRLRSGAGPEVVRQETGWRKSPDDGTWQFEIGDENSFFTGQPGDVFDALNDAERRGLSTAETKQNLIDAGLDFHTGRMFGKAGELFKHDELYARYPELRDVNVEITLGDRAGGAWHKPTYADTPGPDGTYEQLTPGYISIIAPDEDSARKTLIHELGGHGIQHYEYGRATGSNPAHPEVIQPATDFSPRLAERANLQAERVAIWQQRDAWISEQVPDAAPGSAEYKRAEQQWYDQNPELGRQEFELGERVRGLGSNQPTTGERHRAYSLNAGEVNAEIGAMRANYDALMRRAIAPETTFQVGTGLNPLQAWVGRVSDNPNLRPFVDPDDPEAAGNPLSFDAIRRSAEDATVVSPDSVARRRADAMPAMSVGNPDDPVTNLIPVNYEPEFEAPIPTVEAAQQRRGTPYVGAPPDVNSPADEAARRAAFIEMVGKGAENAQWYREGGQAIRSMAGEDPARQTLMSDLTSAASQRQSVGPDMREAARIYNEVQLGLTPEFGNFPMRAANYKRAVAGEELSGPKIGTYYRQMRAGGDLPYPEGGFSTTNDIHMARAWGFPETKGGLRRANHEWIERQMPAVVETLNRNAVGGRTNWTTEEAQAAAWAIARAGGEAPDRRVSYATAARDAETTAQGTRETVPGSNTGHMQELINAPYEVRQDYDNLVRPITYDEQGRDRIAMGMGGLVLPATRGPGIYEGVNPGAQTRLAMGLNDRAGWDIMRGAEATYGLLAAQKAIAGNRITFGKTTMANADGADIVTGATLSQREAQQMLDLGVVDPHKVAVVPTATGLRIFDVSGDQNYLFEAVANTKRYFGQQGVRARHEWGRMDRTGPDGSGLYLQNDWDKPEGMFGRQYVELIESLPDPVVAGFDKNAPLMAEQWLAANAIARERYGFEITTSTVDRMHEAVATRGREGIWRLAKTMGLSVPAAAAFMGVAQAMGIAPPAEAAR